MAEEGPPAGISRQRFWPAMRRPECSPTDWYTMWAAMTALTQEVKLQGRAFKHLSDALAAEAEKPRPQGIAERAPRNAGAIVARPGSGAWHGRSELRPGFWDRIFRRRWRRWSTRSVWSAPWRMATGLSLGYLDDVLVQFQVHPIECVGEPFDPRRMNAVDVEETDRAEEGTVVFVYRAGYEWNGELYRPAQVRVAKAVANGGNRHE